MKRHETYSVLITDDKGKRGTGTLFYIEGSSAFYVLTCAHVIYMAEEVTLYILISTSGDPIEREIKVKKEQFYFSPIDQATVIGNESEHTCDIAIIKCEKGELPLAPTRYAVYPMTSGERVVAIGYPESTPDSIYYQQEILTAEVLRIQSNRDDFVIRVKDSFVNAADRESELKGFSGSPVWDEKMLDEETYLLGGLIASGIGKNIIRGRIKAMNIRLFQSLMKETFGISIETRLPLISDNDIAPGYEKTIETQDQIIVRTGWVENERRKAQTYVDCLQLRKAVDVSKAAIENSEFDKCTNEQKYAVYAVLHEAYRLAGDFDIYDQISEKMRQAGIHSGREELNEAVRYYEAQELDKAEEYIEKALEKNPEGNKERVLALAIRAEKDDSADASIVSEILGPRDQLFIKPADEREEEFIYQVLGYILSNRFRETGRALRCLNRAFQISGNSIILETLALTYYQDSVKNAFIDKDSDQIDPGKIDRGQIDKARDAFLRVFAAADEMWVKGTFRRSGLAVFKCFFFMPDNFRIYKHYPDLMKYYDFSDQEVKRDIQLCYIDVALKKGPINLEDFDALTEHDKKFYELAMLLEEAMRLFNIGIAETAPIIEKRLSDVLFEGEKRLQELNNTQTDNRLSFDGIHSVFANLYGSGIMRYNWQAITEVKRHCAEIKNSAGLEAFAIYIDELQSDTLDSIEKRYEEFFEKHRDIISFEEWCHYYIRHDQFDKAKKLYDSVFEERNYLIEVQPEYFYREYIHFTMMHRYDLMPAIKCFVEHKEEFKDIFICMAIEMDLKFAACIFNNPEQMLEDAKILLNEGIYSQADYHEKCLIINMLNCRPRDAEKFVEWAHGINPMQCSHYEKTLLFWKGLKVIPNEHWNSMQQEYSVQLADRYKADTWLRDPKDILLESGTASMRIIVVDLWMLYFLIKEKKQTILSMFKTIYITHDTVSMALQEINQVNDNDIRRILAYLEKENKVKLLSPTLEQQLEGREEGLQFMEVHKACLLAQELNCPALIGEFRFPIPEKLRSKVIRPDSIESLTDCINETVLMEKKKD